VRDAFVVLFAIVLEREAEFWTEAVILQPLQEPRLGRGEFFARQLLEQSPTFGFAPPTNALGAPVVSVLHVVEVGCPRVSFFASPGQRRVVVAILFRQASAATACGYRPGSFDGVHPQEVCLLEVRASRAPPASRYHIVACPPPVALSAFPFERRLTMDVRLAQALSAFCGRELPSVFYCLEFGRGAALVRALRAPLSLPDVEQTCLPLVALPATPGQRTPAARVLP